MNKIKAEDKAMSKMVWELHCRGLTVTEIQKKLGMTRESVKACIFYKWHTTSFVAGKFRQGFCETS